MRTNRSRTFASSNVNASVLSSLVLLCLLNPAHAQGTPALTFTSDGFTDNSYQGTLGWEFTANSSVTITGLGYYNNRNTLTKSYTVALYDSAGNLLKSGTVGPSANDTTNGAFDYTTLATPITLQSGSSYVIAALINTGDTYYFSPSGVTTASGISYVQNRYDNAQTPTLTFPTSSDDANSGKGYFGPNFLVASAPEPSQWATLSIGMLGLGGLGLRARLRKRKVVM